MAAAEILAIGTTLLSSSDVTVTSSGLAVSLKDADNGTVPMESLVYIELKSDAGTYFRVDALTGQVIARFITAPGVYRFTRPAQAASIGVFSQS